LKNPICCHPKIRIFRFLWKTRENLKLRIKSLSIRKTVSSLMDCLKGTCILEVR
jgi:hypothetical protein